MNTITAPAPTNVNDARRMANSYAKAQEILKEGYTFWNDAASPEVTAVIKPGTTAAAYWINLIEPGCNCPDYVNRGKYCKHTIALEILQDEKAEMEALCAEHDAREALLY